MKNQWTSLSALLASASFLSTPAIADTDVYLTNNTNQVMTIQASHSGSDLLKYGDEWQQHVEQIGPWETKKLISFNRWTGVKSGETYQFNTVVSNTVGESITLNQTVKGHWYNSTLQHGLSAADVNLRLYDDRNIHRSTTDAFNVNTELALKADNTARYDDIYYTITPEKIVEQPEPDANTLKVMTYNIWALPAIASHIGDRYDLIPQYIKGYDVLALQEVFANGRDEFLRELAKEYPFQTKMLDKDGINIYDGV
ncbi:putative phospholipase C precursor [Vibrionales bacterium SWAT-3]|nr:putative phospholipase C precursor [Vibrionales bacterium SWAT-3]